MKSALQFPLRCLRTRAWSAAQALRARLDPAPGRRWVFSARADWMNDVRRSFRGTRHEIAFLPLTDAALSSYDAVVPLTIEDVRHLAARPTLAAHSLVPLPSAATVALCDDKLALNLALQSAGFGAHVPSMGDQARPPYVTKDRIDEHGRSCAILEAAQTTTAGLRRRHNETELVQSYVTGRTEHALHVLFQDGRIRWCLDIEYVFATDRPIKGRHPPRYVCRATPRHLPLWTAMLTTVGYEGLCCINYKDSARGPQLLEINPRCGGSLARHFAVLADHVSREAARTELIGPVALTPPVTP